MNPRSNLFSTGFATSGAMRIARHTNDWCHLCGVRKADLADIFYPENAEHGGRETEYIRICDACGTLIQKVATTVAHDGPGKEAS